MPNLQVENGLCRPGAPRSLIRVKQRGTGPVVRKTETEGVRTVNTSHQLAGSSVVAVRPWREIILTTTDFVDAAHKSIAAVAARALWRFSVPDQSDVT